MRRVDRWNRFIYTLWSPLYRLMVNAPWLKSARRRAFEILKIKAKDRVCLVGVGTGADFPFLPERVVAVGVDLSPAMLAKAKRNLPLPNRHISLQCANAENLPFPDEAFDVTVLTLIVSVAADGEACLREAVRVTKPAGRILVFDKFLRPGATASLGRRVLNLLTRTFGTNINRTFEPMISGLAVRVLRDETVALSGAFRAILLEKPRIPIVPNPTAKDRCSE